MALIDQVKVICDRLAPLGWRDLLLAVTGNALDITQATPAALKQELTKNLNSIDRTFLGFEDFSQRGTSGAAAGQPSLSLLYHALASPLVIRDQNGNALRGYPTPLELDVVENFIFSLNPVSLTQFVSDNGGATKVAFVVFAAEYRPAADTIDGRAADLTFARTGISRVGTARPEYRPETRGFWPEDNDNPIHIRVVPAKFSLWLAVKKWDPHPGSLRFWTIRLLVTLTGVSGYLFTRFFPGRSVWQEWI